jgi:hypothetical protein
MATAPASVGEDHDASSRRWYAQVAGQFDAVDRDLDVGVRSVIDRVDGYHCRP